MISGASRGIGRQCAERLSLSGHTVIGLGRSPPGDSFPGPFYEVDFCSRKQIQAVTLDIAHTHAVNGIVNNVGDPGPERLEDIRFDTLDRVMQVNFFAAVQLVQTFAAGMKKQRYGRIVNLASELALGLPTRTAYGGAKAAIISATRTWALELAAHGVTVNAVAPGPVDTAFFNRNNPPGSDIRQQKERKIPTGRIGQPQDIAHVVNFFMSPETAFVNGQTLYVDGGSSLGATGLL